MGGADWSCGRTAAPGSASRSKTRKGYLGRRMRFPDGQETQITIRKDDVCILVLGTGGGLERGPELLDRIAALSDAWIPEGLTAHEVRGLTAFLSVCVSL